MEAPSAATGDTRPTARTVQPRSSRYNFDNNEQAIYKRFVEMLGQLDKASRLQLAESVVHSATQQIARSAADK